MPVAVSYECIGSIFITKDILLIILISVLNNLGICKHILNVHVDKFSSSLHQGILHGTPSLSLALSFQGGLWYSRTSHHILMDYTSVCACEYVCMHVHRCVRVCARVYMYVCVSE